METSEIINTYAKISSGYPLKNQRNLQINHISYRLKRKNIKKLIHETLSEFLLVSIFANPLNYGGLNVIFNGRNLPSAPGIPRGWLARSRGRDEYLPAGLTPASPPPTPLPRATQPLAARAPRPFSTTVRSRRY
jgi:hypothetical protein